MRLLRSAEPPTCRTSALRQNRSLDAGIFQPPLSFQEQRDAYHVLALVER
jgi:hypothetical protein